MLRMSLADWQISLISASIGTSIPLILVILRDWYVESNRKKEIRNALCSELILCHDALVQSMKSGKIDGDGLLVPRELPVYESFPLNTTFYDDIPIETLAKSVSMEAVSNLQITYNLIYHFNAKRRLVMGGFWSGKETVSNLISQIEKTIKLVKDC